MTKAANDNLYKTGQEVLDALVASGEIVLGADGSYRTPEFHQQWLEMQEAHTDALCAEFLAEGRT